MKRPLLALALMCVVALVAQRSSAQDRKHYLSTMPDDKGRLSIVADNIDKNWTSSEVHFKGSVWVEIWPGTKSYSYGTVIHADEVDLNEKSGEFSVRGNVKVTLEQHK